MMPKFDGYAVMRKLNGWIPSGAYLPILIITADASRIAKQIAPDETTCERFDSS